MRKLIIIIIAISNIFIFSSCNDWLDILPNNEQVTDDYWKSKEDVEAVIASGYYYMRQCVPAFIKWGELRGGTLYYSNGSGSEQRLQDFNLTPSDAICDWSTIYKVIAMANSVIMYAPGVDDNTYDVGIRNAHLSEAYFMRAYCYLLLAKNYRDVPLVLQAYVNDKASFDIAKSTEKEIIAQVKEDVKTALEGAAKDKYETDWQTKGRVTQWALYALMADACLWSEDYDQCIEYCNKVLEATDAFRPVFMSNTYDWFSIFYPGNSNESILELNWDITNYHQSNNFSGLVANAGSSTLKLTNVAIEKLKDETRTVISLSQGMTATGRIGRTLFATYIPEGDNADAWEASNQLYLWKYRGTDQEELGATRQNDANFILYRASELMLIKAQALAMKGQGSWMDAVKLINRIRERAAIGAYIDTASPDAEERVSELNELTLLEEIMNQKEMEFVAEAKRWYDLLWFGRIGGGKYKTQFISKVLQGNQTTNQQWILSVLQDENAWYMPIPQADIEHNKLLEQNPYYSTTK